MNHRILILSAIVLAVVFSSCKKMFEDEELSMERVDYTGTELRTDGYYYYRYQYYDSREDSLYDCFIPWILYRNGVSTYGYVYDYSEVERLEDGFRNGTYSDKMKEHKDRWLVFRISGNTIEFERWDHKGFRLITYKQYAEIINDTTFKLVKEYYNGKEIEIVMTFHFKQFAPKPDSTNSFIK